MAILIEATTVVVTTLSLDRRFPGGSAAFGQQAPNATYRTDGVLAAVSFMVPADARIFARTLAKHGFADPWSAVTDEIAVIDQCQGFLTKSDWLTVDLKSVRAADGTSFGATIAWKGDDEPGTFAVPAGWYPHTMSQISEADLDQNYEMVKVDQDSSGGGSVLTYRHRETGQLLYVGRPSIVAQDAQEQFAALERTLGTLSSKLATRERSKSASELCDRATTLIEQTNRAPRGLFYIQGTAARMAGRWNVAESAFRRVTELWPDELDAWLELTWALSSLDRVDEAIAAARKSVELCPESAPAHGNLASALLQGGRPEDAMPAIERALELDPAEWSYQEIREQVISAVKEGNAIEGWSTDEMSNRPWYKRWFRWRSS